MALLPREDSTAVEARAKALAQNAGYTPKRRQKIAERKRKGKKAKEV